MDFAHVSNIKTSVREDSSSTSASTASDRLIHPEEDARLGLTSSNKQIAYGTQPASEAAGF